MLKTMLKRKKRIAYLFGSLLFLSIIFAPLPVLADEDQEFEEYDSEAEPELDEDGSDDASDLGGYKGLVAHWTFDGNLTDSSQFQNNGEAIGGKSGITFVDAVLGKGVRLDGKSYIKINNSDSLRLTDAFTFSFWVYKEDMRKHDTMEGGVPYLIKYNDEYNYFPYGVYEWWEMTPSLTYADDEGEKETNSQKQVDLQKWTLITATYDGETMKIYFDKELIRSELQSVSLIGSSQPLYIGFGHFMTVDNYFKGILDDMKIYNTALSYSEIEELYDNAVANASGRDLINKPEQLVAYYKFEDDLTDLSGFKNNGTAVKASNFKYVPGIAGKGIKFNGASYIEIKDSDSLDLDKSFTIGAWIYKDTPAKDQPLLTKYGASYDKKAYSYQLTCWNSYAPNLSLAEFSSGGQVTEFAPDSTKDTSDGKWFYYTATYDGEDESDGTVKLYINGKLIKTESFHGDISNSTGPLWIGGTTNGLYFKGILDEIRIYNYALSPAAVKKLFTLKDSLEIVVNKQVSLSSMKPEQNVPLTINLLTHQYSSPTKQLPNGKDEMVKLEVTDKATYKSNNTKVATVSSDGRITAVDQGKSTITVTYGKYSKSITVNVK